MSKRVLVVEDQEDSMRLMNDMLSSAGYEVMKAVTGYEGVAMAESKKPDLILMDVMLPGLDGYQATRRIKDNAALRHIPVIAVTSLVLDGEEGRAKEAGCDAYFSKPFSPRALLGEIRRFIG